jgi:hypothetical protein
MFLWDLDLGFWDFPEGPVKCDYNLSGGFVVEDFPNISIQYIIQAKPGAVLARL